MHNSFREWFALENNCKMEKQQAGVPVMQQPAFQPNGPPPQYPGHAIPPHAAQYPAQYPAGHGCPAATWISSTTRSACSRTSGVPVAPYPAQVMYVQPVCEHQFQPTGAWSLKDFALLALTCFFCCCPWSLCFCPPGRDIQQCVKCGMRRVG